jgi:hypothetical protein
MTSIAARYPIDCRRRTGPLLKYYVTKEEFAALDEATRAHYFALGDDYRIKPEVTNTRLKVALAFSCWHDLCRDWSYGQIDSLQCRFWDFAARCRRCSDFCFI